MSCKDCGSTTRKVSKPGPRCATCRREFKKIQDKARHEAYVLKTYGLQAGEYDKLLEVQGGRCFVCRRASGRTKRLAVDHCHRTGYVRGLLCGPCNKILGHFRDDADTASRVAEYLRNPPAQQCIGLRKP